MPQENLFPSGGPLRVLVHGSLAQAEPGWRALQEAGTCYGFQTFEWLSTWQELLGEPAGVRPAVVEVRSGPPDASDAPVMIVPLGIYPKAGLKILSFLGGRVTDYHAPLLDPAFARSLTPEAFATLWKDILRALPRADYIHFWRMPEQVEGLPNPFARLSGTKIDDQAQFVVLPPTFDEYYRQRSSNFRNRNRSKRKSAERIGPVVFSVATLSAELAPIMDILIRQKSRRHRETTGHDPYAANPRLREFYERLTSTDGDGHKGVLAQLTINGTVVATAWGFVQGKRFLDILSGYEAGQWGKISPGRLMKEDLIRWCIDNKMEIFDFTVGGEAYKASWTNGEMPTSAYHRPLTLAGAVYWTAVQLRLAAKRLLGPLRQQIRQRLQKPSKDESA